MSFFAVMRKQNKEELIAHLSKFQDSGLSVLTLYEPEVDLVEKFQFLYSSDTQVSLMTAPDIIFPSGKGKNYIDLNKSMPPTIFNIASISIIAKTHSGISDIKLEISDGIQALGSVNTIATAKWQSLTSVVKTFTTGITKNIRIRVSNTGVNGVTIQSVSIKMKANLCQKLISDVQKHIHFDKIIVNSFEDEKSIGRNFELINIRSDQKASGNTRSIIEPIVSILTPTYNGLKYIKKCADHLIRNTSSVPYEWLVVDDGSTDGTETYFKTDLAKRTNIRYFSPDPLHNFSKANNFLAAKTKSKYIVLLNNDCYVQKNWLDSLVDRAEADPTIGVVGSLLLFPETKNVQHCGVVFIAIDENGPLPGHMHHHHDINKIKTFIDKPRLYQAVTAACCLIRKDIFDMIGGFDEKYIFGYEDVDLCLKVFELGYKVVFEPLSVAYHEQGGTLDDSDKKAEKHKMFLKNKEVFQNKWKHSPHLDLEQYQKNESFNIYRKKELDTVLYFPITRGFGHDIYRTDHAVNGLRENGIDAKIIDWHNIQWPTAVPDVIVFQRFSSRQAQLDVYNEARQRYPNAPIGYDIDDYIFDPNIATKSKLDESLIQDAHLYDEFMRLCDFFTTTTTYLAKCIQKAFLKPTFVIPNAIDNSFIQTVSHKDILGKTIIGYASGTATHEKDFAAILPALRTTLIRNPNAILRIFGHLPIPIEFYGQLRNQIERLEFMPFSEFPKKFSEFDINIAPLVISDFNHAKSPLKYIEAGALSIPTITSNTSGYREVIKNGYNGIICESEKDWTDRLCSLIEDQDLRLKIAANAKKDVLEKFTTKTVGSNLKTVLQCIASTKYERY